MIWVQEWRGVRDNGVSDSDDLLYCIIIITCSACSDKSHVTEAKTDFRCLLKFDSFYEFLSVDMTSYEIWIKYLSQGMN